MFDQLLGPIGLNWLDPGLAQGFCWLVLNLDASTLGDCLVVSPGLGDTAGDLDGDPGDLDGDPGNLDGDPGDLDGDSGDLDDDGSQGERRATPGPAKCILGPEPTGGFGAPGLDAGGHKGCGVVAAEDGPGSPLSLGGHDGFFCKTFNAHRNTGGRGRTLPPLNNI